MGVAVEIKVAAPCALEGDGATLECAVPNLRQLRCTECEGLAREFQDAWRSDQEDVRLHFHETAKSAGRNPEAFLQQWVMSLAHMPDNEFESLQCVRYPRVAEVRHKWKDHERLTGHCFSLNGWRGNFIFDAVCSGYGFLKGSGLR